MRLHQGRWYLDPWDLVRANAHPTVRQHLHRMSFGHYNDAGLRAAVEAASPEVRRSYFWLAVQLFRLASLQDGFAGGAGCNHWWHRDLHDERVLRDVLGNEFGVGMQRRRAGFGALVCRLADKVWRRRA